jgi:hypothetical protein
MWWKNLKMKLIIAAITLTILGVIAVLIACNMPNVCTKSGDDK